MSTAPAFGSVHEALETLTSAMRYIINTDATQMTTEMQAECLQMFERLDAAQIVARSKVLGRSPPRKAIARTGITVPRRG